MNDNMGHFEELTPLDLKKCNTLDEIVQGMSKCSLGARMLGEVTNSLYETIDKRNNFSIVYDGKPDTPLGNLLQRIVNEKKWFKEIMLPEDYANAKNPEKNILVIGDYSERHEDALYNKSERTIFINEKGRAKPGQTKDGYYPDVIFSDPNYVLPIIYHSLEERLNNNPITVERLFKNLGNYGKNNVAEQVHLGSHNLESMIKDPDCKIIMTLSGTMTVSQMGLVICDLIDSGFPHCILTTGAIISHGLVEGTGRKHYKYNPKHSDALLAKKEINRVTDTLEPETNLDHVEYIISKILDSIDGKNAICPTILTKEIGKYLDVNNPDQRGILKSAYKKDVPIFIPAFVDSEIGNDVYVHNQKRELDGRPKVIMDLEKDTKNLIEIFTKIQKPGIFTIGGGVPRNHAQNVAPLIEILNRRLNLGLHENKYYYGNRVCPDPTYIGNLSACTYNEGKSWRKMYISGKFNEILAEGTLVLPFLAKHIMNLKEKQ